MPALDWYAIHRFIKYSAVGVSTFALDLLLLFIATTTFLVPYQLATPVCFLIGVSLNYFISRRVVFVGTERPIHHGYLYWLVIAIGGALLITALVTALVTYLYLSLLIARVIVAAFIGIANYLINLHFNFRVVGKRL